MMKKRLMGMMVVVMLCACLRSAFAMGSVTVVTKDNQAELGFDYTLVAERISDKAVLVQMEIFREGKLKDLRSVKLTIGQGEGTPLLSAPLQTKPGKGGAWLVSFQLSPELADQCSIDLTVPSAPRTYEIYAAELKGYVTDRK